MNSIALCARLYPSLLPTGGNSILYVANTHTHVKAAVCVHTYYTYPVLQTRPGGLSPPPPILSLPCITRACILFSGLPRAAAADGLWHAIYDLLLPSPGVSSSSFSSCFCFNRYTDRDGDGNRRRSIGRTDGPLTYAAASTIRVYQQNAHQEGGLLLTLRVAFKWRREVFPLSPLFLADPSPLGLRLTSLRCQSESRWDHSAKAPLVCAREVKTFQISAAVRWRQQNDI